MKKYTKMTSVLLIACIAVFGFPMTAAAARPAPPPPTPAISITAEPAGPLELTIGTPANIQITSSYSKALNWSVATTLGTAALSSLKTTPIAGVQTTTLTVSSTAVGAAKVTVTATDSTNKKIKTTLTINIQYVKGTEPTNHAPVFSGPYDLTTAEDTAGTISVIATDADNDTLIYGFTAPAHGVVKQVGTICTYTPAANFSGADSFTVTASDTKTTTSTTVSVTVTPVNDAPVAANDTAAGKAGTTVRVYALANDTDVDTGAALLSILYYGPVSGLTITKGTDYFDVSASTKGVYTFQYTVTDGAAESNLATVTITFSGDLVYVALGDSIPDGYYYTSLWNYLAGGTDSYSYIEQFRDALGILPANYYDESVSGYNTIDVVNQLANTTIRTAIAQADVITLCIGANEIMDAAPRTLSGLDKYNVNWAQADLGRDTFETNWIAIIDGIEALNPDVTLIVMTIYNPYRTTETIYPTVNAYFESTTAGDYGLNYIIRNTETLYDPLLDDDFDYRIADVYSAFNASANKDSLTGFYSSFCDPHPNQTGQNLLFATHMSVYQ